MKKELSIIILFIVIKIGFDIACEETKKKIVRIIKTAKTLSSEKTNDDAIREVLSDVFWREAKRYGGRYKMSVFGYTNDKDALLRSSFESEDCRSSLLDSPHGITFYFHYFPENSHGPFAGEVVVYHVEVDGSDIAYVCRGRGFPNNYRYSPRVVYADLHNSYKKKGSE